MEEVSEFVFARGGSIEDSRMANMHGQFAIAMLISGSQEWIDRITSDLDALSASRDPRPPDAGPQLGVGRAPAAAVPAHGQGARPAGPR